METPGRESCNYRPAWWQYLPGDSGPPRPARFLLAALPLRLAARGSVISGGRLSLEVLSHLSSGRNLAKKHLVVHPRAESCSHPGRVPAGGNRGGGRRTRRGEKIKIRGGGACNLYQSNWTGFLPEIIADTG